MISGLHQEYKPRDCPSSLAVSLALVCSQPKSQVTVSQAVNIQLVYPGHLCMGKQRCGHSSLYSTTLFLSTLAYFSLGWTTGLSLLDKHRRMSEWQRALLDLISVAGEEYPVCKTWLIWYHYNQFTTQTGWESGEGEWEKARLFYFLITILSSDRPGYPQCSVEMGFEIAFILLLQSLLEDAGTTESLCFVMWFDYSTNLEHSQGVFLNMHSNVLRARKLEHGEQSD